MLHKNRLARKFTHKKQIEYFGQLLLILRTQLIFQLGNIIVYCIISLSLRFHLTYIFCNQFWSSEEIISSNLSFTICCFAIIPYLVGYQQVKLTMIKDVMATFIMLHLFICYILNSFTMNFSYLLFSVCVYGIAMLVGTYSAVVMQQRTLINQIQNIERIDRQTSKQPFGECHQQAHRLVNVTFDENESL